MTRLTRSEPLHARGFTLVEVAVVAAILAVFVFALVSFTAENGGKVSEAGENYTSEYGGDVSAATSTGTALPTWTEANNGQAFTILSSSTTITPGVYVFRSGSIDFYAAGEAGLTVGGPWEPAMGCLAGLEISGESLAACAP
jgi:prepilin-type N-terminal cleavage/methylation domain-containing protein